MESPIIAVLRPVARLVVHIRTGVREAALFLLYFAVLGPLCAFRRRPKDPFRSGLCTWDHIHEGDGNMETHCTKT